MVTDGVKLIEVVMFSLLSAFANLCGLDMGERIHGYIRRKNLKVDLVLSNAFIDMYNKCGSMQDAFDAFHIFCKTPSSVGILSL